LRIHVGSEDRFDGAAEDHCHIICTECSAVFDAPFPKGVLSDLEKESGYSVSTRHVEFYGLCPDCK
jgi:Fur family ferric uptake transcriptional regulator/Fur family peroxide stress response transcriptional regulator